MLNHLAIFFQIFTLAKPDDLPQKFSIWYLVLAGSVFAFCLVALLGFIFFQVIQHDDKNVNRKHWRFYFLNCIDFAALTVSFFGIDHFARTKEVGFGSALAVSLVNISLVVVNLVILKRKKVMLV